MIPTASIASKTWRLKSVWIRYRSGKAHQVVHQRQHDCSLPSSNRTSSYPQMSRNLWAELHQRPAFFFWEPLKRICKRSILNPSTYANTSLWDCRLYSSKSSLPSAGTSSVTNDPRLELRPTTSAGALLTPKRLRKVNLRFIWKHNWNERLKTIIRMCITAGTTWTSLNIILRTIIMNRIDDLTQ